MHGYLADIRVESRVKVFRASLRVAVIGMVQWRHVVGKQRICVS